jgi:hypothetical protein
MERSGDAASRNKRNTVSRGSPRLPIDDDFDARKSPQTELIGAIVE